MATELVPVPQAQWASIEGPGVAIRARLAPWADSGYAHDNTANTAILTVGTPYEGNKRVTADRLLYHFQDSGERTFTSLSGSFLVLIWDGERRILSFVTDRLGTQKMYIYQHQSELIFSTEIKALLGHGSVPRRIDETAVGHFLITSHLLDTRSLIKDVHILPPASVTTVDANGVSSHEYWRPTVEPRQQGDLDHWADRIAETVSAAVRSSCGNHPPVLPLSGGLDSRTVAAFVPDNLRHDTAAYTFGHAHCYDVRYGKAVARVRRMPFRFLPLPRDFFRSYLTTGLLLTDGEVSIEALPMLRLLDAADAGSRIITGFLGGVLSGGTLLNLDDFGDERTRLNYVWRKLYQRKGFSESHLKEVLVSSRNASTYEHAYQLMIDALEDSQADNLTDRAMLAELRHRQSRYISYLGRILAYRYRVGTPFLDADVIDTFLSMPLEFRRNQRAYRRMLVRHAPTLAAIRETKSHWSVAETDRQGLPRAGSSAKRTLVEGTVPNGLRWRLSGARNLALSLVVKASRGWIGPHNRRHYVHHDVSIRSVDTAWFRNKLNQEELLEDWFEAPALNKMLEEHLVRKADHSIRINNIITFLEWRRFIGI